MGANGHEKKAQNTTICILNHYDEDRTPHVKPDGQSLENTDQ